ncbi:MAG: hypothetical protein KKA42_09145 [candidate division Zixibacteria bacterium]|nr:hypothetical protein [candidate division Zixibacteria bacterium]
MLMLWAVGPVLGQTVGYEDYVEPRPDNLPLLHWNRSAVSLQTSLYPEFYKSNSAARDLRWVRDNDSALTAFWDLKGDSTLLILSELAGIDWVEQNLTVYLLRYYPSVGESDPLVIPLGGMRQGALNEAAPAGSKLQFNLILQLAKRMLAQAEMSDDGFARALVNHPLMQPGRYRRDNLALLLALVTSQQIIGLDSTFDAYQSAFWKQRTPGRAIMEQYQLSEWILSAQRPLAQWVIDEPMGSRLVNATRPPRRSGATTTRQHRTFIEDLPLKGQLGVSLRVNEANRLVVDKIDLLRLAYACGLREGDAIRAVDGIRVRNHKDFVEKALAGLDRGGATVTVVRDDQTETLLLQPLAMSYEEDEPLYWDETPGESPLYDTLGPVMPDTAAPGIE